MLDIVILYHTSEAANVSSAAPITEQQPDGASKVDQSAAGPQKEGAAKRVKFQKTRKVARWLLAIDAWQRQLGHLKRRASFPLLRRVISIELNHSRNLIQLSDIETSVLERSLLSHCLMLIFVIPASLWAGYTTIKGLSAGIRFDVWLNAWLIQGIPVFVFCAMRALTSNKSRTLISAELALRAKVSAKE